MTVAMQSFGSSTLGAFVESTLGVRDTGGGVVWSAVRGVTIRSRVYQKSSSLTTIRQADLPAGFMVEGCGGSSNVLYCNSWDSTGTTDGGHINEITVDWANLGNATVIASRAFPSTDGCGGDSTTAYLALIAPTILSASPVYKLFGSDAGVNQFGVDLSGFPTNARVDSCGGSANRLFLASTPLGGGTVDEWKEFPTGPFFPLIQKANSPYSGTGPHTEGAGGSASHAYFSSIEIPSYDCYLYEANPDNLATVITGPVLGSLGQEGTRGIGGD